MKESLEHVSSEINLASGTLDFVIASLESEMSRDEALIKTLITINQMLIGCDKKLDLILEG